MGKKWLDKYGNTAARLAILAGVLLLARPAAFAQISLDNRNQHEKDLRRFEKEAAKITANYKESHLDPHATGYTEENRVNRTDTRGLYQFNKKGDAVKRKKGFWNKKAKRGRKN